MKFNVVVHKSGLIRAHHPKVEAKGIGELLKLYGMKTGWEPRSSIGKTILTTTPPKMDSVTVIQISP